MAFPEKRHEPVSAEEVVLMERRNKTRALEDNDLKKRANDERRQNLKRLIVRPPQQFVKQHSKTARQEKEVITARKLDRAEGLDDSTYQLMLVIRTVTKHDASPNINKLLHLLRLDD